MCAREGEAHLTPLMCILYRHRLGVTIVEKRGRPRVVVVTGDVLLGWRVVEKGAAVLGWSQVSKPSVSF